MPNSRFDLQAEKPSSVTESTGHNRMELQDNLYKLQENLPKLQEKYDYPVEDLRDVSYAISIYDTDSHQLQFGLVNGLYNVCSNGDQNKNNSQTEEG